MDEKWATARAENLAGYADVTGSLEQTKEALQGVARANASAVLERDEEVDAFRETFRAFQTETRARLAFCEKAAAWPENATRDFLADVREDKRVVAVLSLERIDEAHRAARPARASRRSALGALAVDIDRAREADGERIPPRQGARGGVGQEARHRAQGQPGRGSGMPEAGKAGERRRTRKSAETDDTGTRQSRRYMYGIVHFG